jgi:hypothetical protein
MPLIKQNVHQNTTTPIEHIYLMYDMNNNNETNTKTIDYYK